MKHCLLLIIAQLIEKCEDLLAINCLSRRRVTAFGHKLTSHAIVKCLVADWTSISPSGIKKLNRECGTGPSRGCDRLALCGSNMVHKRLTRDMSLHLNVIQLCVTGVANNFSVSVQTFDEHENHPTWQPWQSFPLCVHLSDYYYVHVCGQHVAHYRQDRSSRTTLNSALDCLQRAYQTATPLHCGLVTAQPTNNGCSNQLAMYLE